MSRRSLASVLAVALARVAPASAALACVALTATALTPTAFAGNGHTVATVYMPFSPSGAVVMSVKSAKSGYCWTSSETTPRRDAWRCFIGNDIYDPCFSSTVNTRVVLCPTAPWSNSGTEIKLTKGLPLSEANHGAPSLNNQPWALQLTSGHDCLLAGGATAVIGSRRLNYFCSGLGFTIGLWGDPNRKTQPWTIYEASSTATKLTSTVTIAHAWL